MEHGTFVRRHRELLAQARDESATPERRKAAGKKIDNLRETRVRQESIGKRQTS